MHKSRLAGFIIDCRTDDLDTAAEFWAAALGCPIREPDAADTGMYVGLQTVPGDPYFEIQKVGHDSRIHLDIEADDIPAEVARLERLGAKRVAAIRDWVVLEAPTGQRFCVVPVVRDGFDEKAKTWKD